MNGIARVGCGIGIGYYAKGCHKGLHGRLMLIRMRGIMTPIGHKLGKGIGLGLGKGIGLGLGLGIHGHHGLGVNGLGIHKGK